MKDFVLVYHTIIIDIKNAPSSKSSPKGRRLLHALLLGESWGEWPVHSKIFIGLLVPAQS